MKFKKKDNMFIHRKKARVTKKNMVRDVKIYG